MAASRRKGLKLADLVVDKDVIRLSWGVNKPNAQHVQGKFMGLLKVGDDECVVVGVVDGNAYQAVPVRLLETIKRINEDEIVAFTGD